MSMGSVNTSVLPLPVKATPIMSLPERMIGRPWNCQATGQISVCTLPSRSVSTTHVLQRCYSGS